MAKISPNGAARNALIAFKRPLIAAASFSGIINILLLSGSLFMLQVYDRVLPSHSLPTLLALFILIIFLYGFQASLEMIRARLFVRIGSQLDATLGKLVFEASVQEGLGAEGPKRSGSRFRDLEQLRGFLASGGPAAIFDLPWTPVYIALLFLLHPILGFVGLGAIIILSVLTWLADRNASPHQGTAAAAVAEASSLAESARRNAETITPMGMTEALSRAWFSKNRTASMATLASSDASGAIGAVSRFFRQALQSGVLAIGAVLVIRGEASGGVMIAASVLLGRGLAPVEFAISHWRGFVSARQAFARLDASLPATHAMAPMVALPAPTQELVVDGIWVSPDRSREPIVRNVGFRLEASEALGVIGPSGSGKSSLVRAIVGVWPILRGSARLDGATLDQWTVADRGRFLGYLPQTVELFEGTIGQNISRFDVDATSDAILAAAQSADLLNFIKGLPNGFDTLVGDRGDLLSAGQRQRIALARALYGDPFLVVLDEPNSSLDAEGEAALTQAIISVRKRGGIVIVVAHRPSALQAVSKVLVMADGAVRAFGPRDEVLQKLTQQATAVPGTAPSNQIPEQQTP
jgi:PrtD family type I secretion system ABC transporter